MTYRYGSMKAAELPATIAILSSSFGTPADDVGPWLETAGHENVRVLRDGAGPVATLIHIPMGQHFGGRSVPMVGIAGVACPPHRRGDGAATELMRRSTRELHRRGVAISALYPAVQSLYRRAGYEQAVVRFETSVAARDLGDGDRTLSVRPFVPTDWPAVKRVYEAVAPTRPGSLDRGPYCWARAGSRRGQPAIGHVVEEDGAITGYLFHFEQTHPDSPIHRDVSVQDMASSTDRARRRLLTLLGDTRSLADRVVWFGPAHDARLFGIEERRYEVRAYAYAMIRIVDVAAALEARGYPRGLRAELHLDVRDDVVPSNSGRYSLRVEDGRGRVSRAGRGSLGLDVRTLAPLFTGFASPAALAERDALRGTPAAMDVAAQLFAGPQPTLSDMF